MVRSAGLPAQIRGFQSAHPVYVNRKDSLSATDRLPLASASSLDVRKHQQPERSRRHSDVGILSTDQNDSLRGLFRAILSWSVR